jgi:hypothetical protein
MAMDLFRNFAYTGVLVPPTPANLGTSLTVYAGTSGRFPAAPFSVSVWPLGLPADPTNAEILRVTAKAGDVWTIQRQQEGSSARAILLNDQIAQAMTVKAVDDLKAELKAYTDARIAATVPPPTLYVPPRVWRVGDTTGINPNVDAYDVFAVDGIAVSTYVGSVIGTPEDAQAILFRFRDNGTARALGWDTTVWMSGSYVPLPTATIAYKTLHIGFRFNALYGKWFLLAVTQEP